MMKDMWVSHTKGGKHTFLIASPDEKDRILRTKKCTNEGVRAGFKAASMAFVASAVITLTAVRMIPWAKANLKHTAQALVVSGASIAGYFITVDKTILECARKNAQLQYSLTNHK